MGKIIIVGRVKKQITLNDSVIEIRDNINDISKDFILELFGDSKKEIGYESDSKIEAHSKDFEHEIIRYAKRKMIFKGKEFEIILSRKTYQEAILIECGIEYENGDELFDAVYDFKIKIKEWMRKYCKPIYWVHDDNNSEICTNAYQDIYKIENKFRQILSLYMMRRCGDIYLNKELESEFEEYSNFYYQNRYGDFKDINSKLYNIGFSKLPKLLDLNVTQVIVEEEGSINEIVEETISILSDIGNITYSYNKIEKLKKKLNKKIGVIQRGEHIFNNTILAILDDEFKKKWDKLSGMRNMVMHNKPICKKLFHDIKELCENVEGKFELCLEHIESRFYTEEEYIYDCLCDEEAEKEEYDFDFIEQERENAGIQFQLSEDYVLTNLSENQEEINLLMTILQNIDELSSEMENIYGDIDEICEQLKSFDEEKLKKLIVKVNNKLGIEVDVDEFDATEETSDLINALIYNILGNLNIEELYSNLVDNTKIDDCFSIDKIAVFGDCNGGIYNIDVRGDLAPEDAGRDYLECVIYKNNEILKKAIIEIYYGDFKEPAEGNINADQIYVINNELTSVYEEIDLRLRLISNNIKIVKEFLKVN